MKNITSMKVGQTESFTKVITDSDLRLFAEITGDNNPIHLDDVYAATTRFERRIAHGMLLAGMISAVLGTKLPGPGSIYLSQSLKFVLPIFINDEVTATVEVIDIRADKPIVTLRTTCKNQNQQIVVNGEAVLLVKFN